MNVQHEYVVCRIFSYTFEKTTSTWYFDFPVGSITNWGDFQKSFIDKFREETTTGALMTELFSLFMVPKEKVKDFNQIFTIVLNKFKDCTALAPELQMNVYANALPIAISMFVK
jgi:hypothetical protein